MLLCKTKLPVCKAGSDFFFLLDSDILSNNPELAGTHQKVSYRRDPVASHSSEHRLCIQREQLLSGAKISSTKSL